MNAVNSFVHKKAMNVVESTNFKESCYKHNDRACTTMCHVYCITIDDNYTQLCKQTRMCPMALVFMTTRYSQRIYKIQIEYRTTTFKHKKNIT